MATLCESVELFVDGELPPDEAEAFRNHLPDCVRCQREVANLVQLDLMGQSEAERAAAQASSAPPRLAPSPSWRPLTLVAASLLALVLIGVGVRLGLTPRPQGDLWLARLPQRPLEARLSYPEADRYRPPPSQMLGAGELSKEFPLEEMAALKGRTPLALVAAWLVHQDPKQAEKVLQGLDAEDYPGDLENYRAVVALLLNRPAAALGHTAQALEQVTNHPQALWNRALALERLHLPLLAARTFEHVASLKEPGWAEEAARRAEDLKRTVSKRRAHWKAVVESGKALVEAGPAAIPEGFSRTPITRVFFYEAVRAATSREQVLALLPLAQELDAWAGSQVLERYVQRVAQADFTRRAPLAREYAALAKNQFSQEQPRQARLLEELLTSGEDDLLLGTLVHMGPSSHQLPLLEEKAAATGDPWFQLIAAQVRAKAAQEAGTWSLAIQVLLEALGRCPQRGLEYRCISIERDLTGIYLQLHQFDGVLKHAENGLVHARDHGEWYLETAMLWQLAQLARFINDAPLARARYKELLERHPDDDDQVKRGVPQHLADIEWHELRVDAARQEMNAALATGTPLSLSGAYTLADIARIKSTPADEAHINLALQAAARRLSAGERAKSTHIRGRFFIERDPAQGLALLWQAIEAAEAPGLEQDPQARGARRYSFTSLLMHAGRHGDFEEALRLLARERGQPLPSQCLLVASVDSERTLLLILDAAGELTGSYEDTRRQPLPLKLDGLVPPKLQEPLRRCSKVDVLARPPLHGRAGLLPPDFVWSYLTHTSAPPVPTTGPKEHLVVSDVALPPDSEFKRLSSWIPSFGADEKQVLLTGTRATPSNVLAAMKGAHEIDIMAHGIINGRTTTSYLQLAPESEGSELSMEKVRRGSLRGAPFVMLAACHAAHTSYSLHEPLSLPAAFIEAGARGVLAATEEVPDQEVTAFFNAIRERMRSGTHPALALRDERIKWLGERRGGNWLDSILLFE